MGFMQLNHIANTAVPSSSGRTIAVLDPSDGEVFDEIQRSSAADIDMAVQAARHCFNGHILDHGIALKAFPFRFNENTSSHSGGANCAYDLFRLNMAGKDKRAR